MARSRPAPGYKNLLRFYKLAVPYWKLIAVSVLASAVYSAVGFGIVLLIGPTVAAFERHGQTLEQAPTGSAAGQEGGTGAGAALLGGGKKGLKIPTPDFLDKAKDRLRNSFLSLWPVKTAKAWLYTDASLKKVAFVLAFILGPLILASGFLQDYAQSRAIWSIVANLRMAVFDRISGLSLRYFSSQRTGELISRLTNDISRTDSALGVLFGTLVLQPLMLAFLVAGAFTMSPQLMLIAAVAAPVVVFLTGRFGISVRRRATKTLAKLADVTDSVTQMLNGIRVVKSFHMEQAERDEFRARNEAQLAKAFKLVRTQAWAGVLPDFLLGVLSMSLVLLVADRLLTHGQLDLKNMLQFVACMVLAGGRVRRLVRGYIQLQQSMASVNRVFELIDARPEIEDLPDAVKLGGVRKGVQFDDVWFAYDQAPVLKGIDLFVPCGKTYAIVGETGAGKSTMLDLIPRFYDPIRGAVKIDGVDVRKLTRASLMSQIAIVGQRPFLFNRPIGENIRYGKPDATDEEVIAAAKAANIHNFILALPKGYDTIAGEAGDRFSGGQRQCLTIARAILRNAPILILDEATSSLDAESEMLVQTALENLMVNRTTFVIAHRLSTVRYADQIIVLKDGRIIEHGPHEELLARRGEYQRLYRLQFADRAAAGGGADAQGSAGAGAGNNGATLGSV
jgi:subfamily B ATP-binding cassette protein MsbA